MPKLEVLGDSVIHKRYLTVTDRKVKVTKNTGEESVLHYDVVGHPQCAYRFSVAFPLHAATDDHPAQVTIIREWAQGVNDWVYCLPTGGFDPRKHKSLQDTAIGEMSEEAMLKGGTVVRLLPEDHEGFAEVKWCQNRFVPFLFIDPQPDPTPGKRDMEEHSMAFMRVSIDEFKRLMVSGDMMLPSITTGYLALAELETRGLL